MHLTISGNKNAHKDLKVQKVQHMCYFSINCCLYLPNHAVPVLSWSTWPYDPRTKLVPTNVYPEKRPRHPPHVTVCLVQLATWHVMPPNGGSIENLRAQLSHHEQLHVSDMRGIVFSK